KPVEIEIDVRRGRGDRDRGARARRDEVVRDDVASARADHGPGGEDRDPPFGGEGRNERRCERHHEERSGQERGFLDKHGCLPIESEWFSVMRRGITEAQSPFPTLRDGPKLSESNRPTAESISGPAASL